MKNRSAITTGTPTAPVALYARYSTDRQDARSIDDQLRKGRALATSRGEHVAVEYVDAAISGSHTERADLQRLLVDARRGAFRGVIVDDLSRLSRDLGDTWRIVFQDLASDGIRVVDAATGMASDAEGARLTFGAMALVNDTFLQLVRKETHRGLEGRALQGFATGGKCFGYTTVVEENPPQPEHPRKVPVIDPAEAAIVQRAFQMFADGGSYHEIARTLNEERIAAPHDGGPKGRKGNKHCHGWGHTTYERCF
jgi:site-specific DNA recombinase